MTNQVLRLVHDNRGGKALIKGKQKVRISSSSEGEYISDDSGQELDS